MATTKAGGAGSTVEALEALKQAHKSVLVAEGKVLSHITGSAVRIAIEKAAETLRAMPLLPPTGARGTLVDLRSRVIHWNNTEAGSCDCSDCVLGPHSLLADVAAALESAPPTWQPMDTGPKEIGQAGLCLAWWPNTFTVPVVTWWNGDRWMADDVEDEWSEPTHWMPLPAAPAADAAPRQETER